MASIFAIANTGGDVQISEVNEHGYFTQGDLRPGKWI